MISGKPMVVGVGVSGAVRPPQVPQHQCEPQDVSRVLSQCRRVKAVRLADGSLVRYPPTWNAPAASAVSGSAIGSPCASNCSPSSRLRTRTSRGASETGPDRTRGRGSGHECRNLANKPSFTSRISSRLSGTRLPATFTMQREISSARAETSVEAVRSAPVRLNPEAAVAALTRVPIEVEPHHQLVGNLDKPVRIFRENLPNGLHRRITDEKLWSGRFFGSKASGGFSGRGRPCSVAASTSFSHFSNAIAATRFAPRSRPAQSRSLPESFSQPLAAGP